MRVSLQSCCCLLSVTLTVGMLFFFFFFTLQELKEKKEVKEKKEEVVVEEEKKKEVKTDSGDAPANGTVSRRRGEKASWPFCLSSPHHAGVAATASPFLFSCSPHSALFGL